MFHHIVAVIAIFFFFVTRLFVFILKFPLKFFITTIESAIDRSKQTFVIRMELNEKKKNISWNAWRKTIIYCTTKTILLFNIIIIMIIKSKNFSILTWLSDIVPNHWQPSSWSWQSTSNSLRMIRSVALELCF